MASELRVNTLKDAAGNNSIATSFVAGGSAKMWTFIEGGGTPTITGSFNTASITDEELAVVRANFTSSMADTDYSNVGTPSDDIFIASLQELPTGPVRATSSMVLKSHSTTAPADTKGRQYVLFGDLA